MITLSNGHRLEYVVPSGTLGLDGQGGLWKKQLVRLGLIKPELFTVGIKTLTRHPRRGNLRWWKPWECVRLIPGGSVNKVGLTNPGVEWWCRKIGPYLDYEKFPLIGSIYGNQKELVEMAEMLNRFDFKALEVNPSCPNTSHGFQAAEAIIRGVRAVHQVSRHPILVKVSYDQDYLGIAQGLAGIAEGVSLNSVAWKTVFPHQPSPLSKLEKRVGGGGGGVSGKPAQKYNWRAVERLALQNALPVIGPSVMEFEDLATLRNLGAQAVSFGVIHMRTPWKATQIVEQDMKWRYSNHPVGSHA